MSLLLVEAVEEDKQFREEVKGMIDEVVSKINIYCLIATANPRQ